MPAKLRKTRHSSGPSLCSPCELPDSKQLYTKKCILSAIKMEQKKNPSADITDIAKKIEPIVGLKWKEVNPCLSVITPDSVIKKIVRIYETDHKMNIKQITPKKKKFFMDNLDKLFDILSCKCPFVECDPTECGSVPCDIPHIHCDCLRHLKIPVIELAFIKDQRDKVGLNGGKVVMGGVNKVTAEQQENTKKKKDSKVKKTEEHAEEIEEKNRHKRGKFDKVLLDSSKDQGDAGDGTLENSDSDYSTEEIENKETEYTTTDIRIFVAECIRYQISDRASVALYNAALKTLGPLEENKIVDKSKYRREKAKFGARQNEKKINETKGGLGCIGADGKRNKKTRVKEIQVINGKEVEKFLRKTREHMVYTAEPGGEYLEHSEIPEGKGTGLDLSEDFYEVVLENNSVETLEAVLLDGTAVNTGPKTGCICYLERKLKRKLLWLICQLHGNELPLRHVFDYFDGGFGTSGPNSFKGPIGQACTGDEIHLDPVVQFLPIPSSVEELPDSVKKDLSRDQLLLHGYAMGIVAGF